LGINGFQSLNGFYSARSIGTGNNLLSVVDNDLVLSSENPALLNNNMRNQLAINQTLLPTGVNFGSVQYAFKSKIGITGILLRQMKLVMFLGNLVLWIILWECFIQNHLVLLFRWVLG
jgi:hypothetical protein